MSIFKTLSATEFETMSFEPPQQYFVPANTHSAYRIQGGSYSIIEALYQNIFPKPFLPCLALCIAGHGGKEL